MGGLSHKDTGKALARCAPLAGYSDTDKGELLYRYIRETVTGKAEAEPETEENQNGV